MKLGSGLGGQKSLIFDRPGMIPIFTDITILQIDNHFSILGFLEMNPTNRQLKEKVN